MRLLASYWQDFSIQSAYKFLSYAWKIQSKSQEVFFLSRSWNFLWKFKEYRMANTVWKNKGGRVQDIQMHYKATVTEPGEQNHTDRHIKQQTRAEPRGRPAHAQRPDLWKRCCCNSVGETMALLINDAEMNGNPFGKKVLTVLYTRWKN